MILRRCEGDHGIAVDESKNRRLFADEKLLHEHLRPGVAEAALDEKRLHRLVNLRRSRAHRHSFAGREAIGLEHYRYAEIGDSGARFGFRPGDRGSRGGHLGRCHYFLCEFFAAFHLCSRLAGAESGQTPFGEFVDESEA